jgi:hypothetical protein
MCLLFCGESPAQSIQRTEEHRATNAEEKEARDLAIKFTIDFAETQDLTPIIKDLYFRDFVERYKVFKTKTLNTKQVDLYFAPGLEYSSQLLATADSTDWKDFYVATNNFLLLGYISGLKKSSDETQDIKATDLYPSEVMELLHTNPTLANMIERKESVKAVGTVGEMKAATATLSQAVAMIREKNKGEGPLIRKKDELTKVMMHDEVFKPRVEVLDDNYFGFPKNTRILFINTAIGLQLMLAKDTDRLRIFWTEIISN